MKPNPVPSYKSPPVVEVVWSAQFARLPWLTAAHTGLYWEVIRREYPVSEEQPPIDRKDEPEQLLFKPPQVLAEVLARPPLCRQWFISRAGNELVQLQPDLFCLNWRKRKPADVYPRYPYMRKRFKTRWAQFCGFIEAEGKGSPEVDLLEMTYVNHIFKEEGWTEPRDIGKVFLAISFHKKSKFLPPPATLGSNMVFDICGPQGRLYVSCRHAKTMDAEQKEMFRLELVARGRPKQNDPSSLLAWFAQAREWIVRGFADLTNQKIQEKEWGREQ